MREPSLEEKPFSQCTVEELKENILPYNSIIRSIDDSFPKLLQIDVAKRYAAILINEKS